MKYPLLALPFLTGIALGQQPISPRAMAEMKAVVAEKETRSPSQRKMQSSLVYLAREAAGKKAVEGAPLLKSHIRREADGRVTVEISAPPSAALTKAITDLGGTVVYESERWKSVRATLPPAAVEAIAARADVKAINKAATMTTHTVTNEADAAHKANVSRVDFGVSGAGVKVGVLSDSVDHLAASQASGELPMSLTVLPGRSGVPASGEGTAMLEIVHDIAPDAQLYFATAGPGKVGFADSIALLRAAGCQIIVDDISYSTAEWQFQDDEIGQAVNAAVADGAVYLSSSGNEGSKKRGTSTTWEGDFLSGGAAVAPLPTGTVQSFGANNYNATLAGSDPSFAVLQWSDAYGASGNDYDLYVLDTTGTSIVSSSADTQDGTGIPLETVDGVLPGQRVVIWKSPSAADRYLRLITPKAKLQTSTAGQTIGHAGTAKCICVAASDAWDAVNNGGGTFTTSSAVENSSSDGPHRMFFKPNGSPLIADSTDFSSTGGNNLQTPAITGGDGGATSVPGFADFYGTSAAAPATAAIAALVLSKNPTLTNTQMRTILETSCLDIEGPGFEINSGNGILMAD
ncbi:MAG: S8 family serine peptidase, partial [Luteolibacter sp.]